MALSVQETIERDVISAAVNKGAARHCLESGLRPDDMVSEAHQRILAAVYDALATSGAVDSAAVFASIDRNGWGEVRAELSAACESEPSSALDTQIHYLRTEAMRRRIARIGDGIVRACREGKRGTADIATSAAAKLKEIVGESTRIDEDDADHTADAVSKILTDGPPPTTPTGFSALDNLIRGWNPGELTLVAGATAMGKSAFALSSADELDSLGVPSALINLEMGTAQTLMRRLARRTLIPLRAVKEGRLSRDEMLAAAAFVEASRSSALRVFNRPGASSFDVENIVARLEPDGVKVFYVDQLDLMTHPTIEKGGRNDLAIRKTTKHLHVIAQRYGVAIVVLHQLNRSGARAGKPPVSTDLRDSAVENDASNVITLHRAEYHGAQLDESAKGHTIVSVTKSRDHGTGRCELRFIGECTRFEAWDAPSLL